MLYLIGNYFIELPADHPLPQYQQANRMYDRGFIPLLRTLFDSVKTGWVVDVGATVGTLPR
jgi:hypothetical protein